MQGYFALVLHAHLPYVRHPDHDRFLEESWLFEAITETYLPLLERIEAWAHDQLDVRLTLTLTPTLCSMLLDPLLQDRYVRYLDGLIELAGKETYRTHWEPALQSLAERYLERFRRMRERYLACHRNLIASFAALQAQGFLEIITCAATHAVLPLLQNHPACLRGQILTARDHYRSCFGRDPRGIWLPECAYTEEVEPVLQEVNIRWFITEAHGVLHAQPLPRYGLFAPLFTPNGLAVFGRDVESARQVWSKEEGYPGDPVYRDFYRDIGHDLDFDYLQAYLPAPPHRSFTGIKYYAISTRGEEKKPYDPAAALVRAEQHAGHFLSERGKQIERLSAVMDRPPVIVSAYDAELFGHWWSEGPDFLDLFVRKAAANPSALRFITPDGYLHEHTTNQVAKPSASSWGEEGYWKVWLNEKNEWIYPHLQIAQERMIELARRFPAAAGLTQRALNQAAREILLAQSSDWPFILRTGTSPAYATKRVKEHLIRFHALHEQLTSTRIDEAWLAQTEWLDNPFPQIDYRHWS
ncbi:MAG: 1,4-alpha-glucan branching protein domain-containing protein [Verrucomicrobiota bacterium]